KNKKEYWYLKNTDEAMSRLTKKEKKELDDVEQYNLVIKDRIDEEDIEGFTDYQMQVTAITRQLDKAYALTPEVIKNEDISVEEYAEIAEQLSILPGINTTTEREREKQQDKRWKSIVRSSTPQ